MNKRGLVTLQKLLNFHPGMVFLANLGVNLHACWCGDPQTASAQAIDFIDIDKP